MALTDKFPGIVKVNSSHNGFGKSKIDDMDHFRDMSTVLTLHSHYATAEAFIDGDFMIRVQKIGPHYRVLKRIIEDKKNWKNDFDEECTSIPLEPQFKFWVDSCSDFYGGMDILSVDAIFKDEQYHIFGLNGSNIKISKKFSEDLLHMAELIVAKIKKNPIPLIEIDTQVETIDEWNKNKLEMDQIYKEVKERIFKEYEYDENDKKEVEIKPKEKKSNYLQKIFFTVTCTNNHICIII